MTAPLTAAEIAELERLHAAATPGPWIEYGQGWSGSYLFGPDENATSAGVYPSSQSVAATDAFHAAYIARVHNALPALLAELKRAREADPVREALVAAINAIRAELSRHESRK